MKADAPNTLVVLHQGAIGDFVLAMSIIQAAARRTQAARVVAVASAPSAALAGGRSVINQRFAPDDLGLHTLFNDSATISPPMQSLLSTATCVLSFLGSPASSLHERLSRSSDAPVFSVDPRPTTDTLAQRRHITTQWHNAIAQAGLDLSDIPPPVIRMPSPPLDAAHRPHILIHPGSGGRSKCWPVKNFLALAQRLTDCTIGWMLGPAECEPSRGPVASIARRCEARGETLFIDDDILKAASHIRQADLYLGNDAGMTHIAAAIGIATVAIYGPTDPAVWRPLGDHVLTVTPAQPGRPISQVPVVDVENALHNRLAKLP